MSPQGQAVALWRGLVADTGLGCLRPYAAPPLACSVNVGSLLSLLCFHVLICKTRTETVLPQMCWENSLG